MTIVPQKDLVWKLETEAIETAALRITKTTDGFVVSNIEEAFTGDHRPQVSLSRYRLQPSVNPLLILFWGGDTCGPFSDACGMRFFFFEEAFFLTLTTFTILLITGAEQPRTDVSP